MRVARWVILAWCCQACAGYAGALERGQRYYEDNQFERALALWRHVGEHEDAMSPAERARYAYLRGMTDYRLGFRRDARHWLALAEGHERRHPGSLEPAWLQRLTSALGDLNAEVFGIRPGGADSVQSIEMPNSDGALPTAPHDPPSP